jgi:hypothetical protein
MIFSVDEGQQRVPQQRRHRDMSDTRSIPSPKPSKALDTRNSPEIGGKAGVTLYEWDFDLGLSLQNELAAL